MSNINQLVHENIGKRIRNSIEGGKQGYRIGKEIHRAMKPFNDAKRKENEKKLAKVALPVAGLGLAGLAAHKIKRATMSNMDKAKEAAETLKDAAPDIAAGGTALGTVGLTGLGAGVAAKKVYKMIRRKK